MTDWLDDVLDSHPGAVPPAGFAAGVAARARAGRLLRFPRLVAVAAAGLMLLAVGYWLGNGAPKIHGPVQIDGSPDAAALSVDEIWQDRELLENLELLSDDALELAFRDATSGAWVLDEAVPDDTEDGQ